jgi:hypothetical protein
VYATLTDKGEALIDQTFPRHAEEIHDLFSVRSSDEQDMLHTLLKKLGHAERRCGGCNGGRASFCRMNCSMGGRQARPIASRCLAPDGETL